MAISKTVLAAGLTLGLAGCGGAAQTDAQSGLQLQNTATALPREPDVLTAAPTNAIAPTAAPEEDVTAAGFPFKPGTYVTSGKCTPDNYARYEFAKKFRHQYEADQQQDFTKIVRLGPGRYRVSEHIEADEKVDNSDDTIVYTASGPDGFTSDEPVVDYNDKGDAVPRKGETMHYKWCSDASLGIEKY